MSAEKVKNYFKQFGLDGKILTFDSSSATVELAAKAVGCEPMRIAKTLSFLVNDEPVLIVVAGDSKVNNQKFREQFHVKAKMIPFDKVEELVGFAPGGVCPFAVNDNVSVYLDNSLKRFETVFPAAGESNNAIELTLEELEQYSNSKGFIDVSVLC